MQFAPLEDGVWETIVVEEIDPLNWLLIFGAIGGGGRGGESLTNTKGAAVSCTLGRRRRILGLVYYTYEQLKPCAVFSRRSPAAKASKSACWLLCAARVSMEGPPACSKSRAAIVAGSGCQNYACEKRGNTGRAIASPGLGAPVFLLLRANEH